MYSGASLSALTKSLSPTKLSLARGYWYSMGCVNLEIILWLSETNTPTTIIVIMVRSLAAFWLNSKHKSDN